MCQKCLSWQPNHDSLSSGKLHLTKEDLSWDCHRLQKKTITNLHLDCRPKPLSKELQLPDPRSSKKLIESKVTQGWEGERESWYQMVRGGSPRRKLVGSYLGSKM